MTSTKDSGPRRTNVLAEDIQKIVFAPLVSLHRKEQTLYERLRWGMYKAVIGGISVAAGTALLLALISGRFPRREYFSAEITWGGLVGMIAFLAAIAVAVGFYAASSFADREQARLFEDHKSRREGEPRTLAHEIAEDLSQRVKAELDQEKAERRSFLEERHRLRLERQELWQLEEHSRRRMEQRTELVGLVHEFGLPIDAAEDALVAAIRYEAGDRLRYVRLSTDALTHYPVVRPRPQGHSFGDYGPVFALFKAATCASCGCDLRVSTFYQLRGDPGEARFGQITALADMPPPGVQCQVDCAPGTHPSIAPQWFCASCASREELAGNARRISPGSLDGLR